MTMIFNRGLIMTKSIFPPKVADFLEECTSAAFVISEVRQQQLQSLADYIRDKTKAAEPIKLIFICTHNSRRSQMAQLAAKSAAIYYSLEKVETYSGGTEATAFNSNAIDAIKNVGYEVTRMTGGDNPRYKIAISDFASEEFFSKEYSDDSNPFSDFAAVTVCSDAERACPYVKGAEARFSLPYEDPKVYDNSPDAAKAYRGSFLEITKEMMYAFSKAIR